MCVCLCVCTVCTLCTHSMYYLYDATVYSEHKNILYNLNVVVIIFFRKSSVKRLTALASRKRLFKLWDESMSPGTLRCVEHQDCRLGTHFGELTQLRAYSCTVLPSGRRSIRPSGTVWGTAVYLELILSHPRGESGSKY